MATESQKKKSTSSPTKGRAAHKSAREIQAPAEEAIDVRTREAALRPSADRGLVPYDPDVPSREAILQHLRETGQPLTPEELADRLGVVRDSTKQGFERRLSAMERDGQLLSNRRGELLLASKLDFIAGTVQGHRDGYGFLIRDDGGPDLFLSPREMLKVLHGDRVLARQAGEHRGKPDGQIVEVIERRTDRLVGRFLRERGIDLVVPEDQRIKHDVLITPDDTGGAKPGQVVTVEILAQPTRHTQPIGRVVEVLGEINDPGMEVEIAVRKFGVPHEFSPEAQRQADKLPTRVRKADWVGRIDLTDVPFITIDGADARDFDDAVYCEPVELGTASRKRPGWRLLVAIADVSHYVLSGSPLDEDAIERGTSVYFPRRVIPMLPEVLSNGLCSLNPNVERLALVCDMVIPATGAKAGTVTAYQFFPAVIKSYARTTYEQVWRALSGDTGTVLSPIDEEPLPLDVIPHVTNLHHLYQVLSDARKKRGAIDFDTVETRIVCNEIGRIERIVPYVRNDAHRIIEECMLAANTCAADFMQRSRHPGLYRVHEGPTEEKLDNLRQYLRTLGLTLGGGDSPEPSDYMKLLEQAAGRPDVALIETMSLRSMQQAMYSPENIGHFGLAYAAYTHFTSPIRRYPDLLTHRVIKHLIAGERYVPTLPEELRRGDRLSREAEHGIWERLGMLCSAHERRADEATRDVEAWLKAWYMRERVGESFAGTITGVAPFGIFVTLADLYVEGMVHVSELGPDYFQFNESLSELRGERTGKRYRVMDKVVVQVARVDLEARRIEFQLEKGVSYASGRRATRHTARAADSSTSVVPVERASVERKEERTDSASPKMPAKLRRAAARQATRETKARKAARVKRRRT